jgi:hypothetical protein
MIRATVLAALVLLAAPASAQQGWGDLDRLLAAALLPQDASLNGAFWLPDDADPSRAREALAVTYFEVPGGGNSARISSGYFVLTNTGWSLARPLSGLFGGSPRDVTFLPDRIELTTTMPKPGDPRCCPTGTGRWSVDRATGQVARLE